MRCQKIMGYTTKNNIIGFVHVCLTQEYHPKPKLAGYKPKQARQNAVVNCCKERGLSETRVPEIR